MPDRSESDEKPDADTRLEFGQSTRRTFLSRLRDGKHVGHNSARN